MAASGREHRHSIYRILLPSVRLPYFIFRSTFLPRILGARMAIGGLSWLTYMSPPLVNYLSPYNLALSILGQESVMLWLLVMGVNAQRWKEQASAALRVTNHSK